MITSLNIALVRAMDMLWCLRNINISSLFSGGIAAKPDPS